MTKHLLLPGVDAVEEEALQIHQDVVTYMQREHGKCSPGYLISCMGIRNHLESRSQTHGPD